MTTVSWTISGDLHLLKPPLVVSVSLSILHLEKANFHLRPELHQMLALQELGDSLSLEIVFS